MKHFLTILSCIVILCWYPVVATEQVASAPKFLLNSRPVQEGPHFRVYFDAIAGEIRINYKSDTVYFSMITLTTFANTPAISIMNPGRKAILYHLGNQAFDAFEKRSTIKMTGKRAVIVVFDPSVEGSESLMKNALNWSMLSFPISTAPVLFGDTLGLLESKIKQCFMGHSVVPSFYLAIVEGDALSQPQRMRIAPSQAPHRMKHRATFSYEDMKERGLLPPVVAYISPALDAAAPINLSFDSEAKSFLFKFNCGEDTFNAKFEFVLNRGQPSFKIVNSRHGGVMIFDVVNGALFGMRRTLRHVTKNRQIIVLYECSHLKNEALFGETLTKVLRNSSIPKTLNIELEEVEKLNHSVGLVLREFNKYYSGFYLVIIDPPTNPTGNASLPDSIDEVSNETITHESIHDEQSPEIPIRPQKRKRFHIDSLLGIKTLGRSDEANFENLTSTTSSELMTSVLSENPLTEALTETKNNVSNDRSDS